MACVFSSALLEDWDEELRKFSRWNWEGVRKTDEGRIYASIFGGIGSEIMVMGKDWWAFELNLETSGFLFQVNHVMFGPPPHFEPSNLAKGQGNRLTMHLSPFRDGTSLM